MCTNYENDASPAVIADRFGLKDLPGLPPKANLRPTDTGLVIGPGTTARVLRWGFIADWSKQPIVNARCETLAGKPTFEPALENRCLVPASAYFEWRHDGKNRLKNRISLPGGGLMAFAGLVFEDRFTIITCQPTPALAHIHNRMPVILERRAEAHWIDPDAEFADVEKWLVPYAGDTLQAIEDTPPPDRQADLFA